MFLISKGFKFLDVINYLGPGKGYDEWVKAYGCELKKSWFPYEWFDIPDKLDFPGLPDYLAWYSRLKGKFPLTLREWKCCKRLFREKKMKTFSDWLQYYNNLDVAPGLEALRKMRKFYIKKGIDILKDAVGIPGVTLHYLLKGSLKPSAPSLWAPGAKDYKLLKGAVVGGPSLVFTRYHEAGVTRIRSLEGKICKNILGYDANALYLSTMAKEMPCGKGEMEHFTGSQRESFEFTRRKLNREWFGFAEVDIRIPQILWKKFEEMPPFFIN